MKDNRRTCASHRNQSKNVKDHLKCNGVTLAGVFSGNQIATWTKDAQEKHEATLQRVTKHVHIRSGGSDQQTTNRTSCLETLLAQRATGSTCKLRVAARGFAQTVSPNADFYGGILNLATSRRLLTLAAIWSHSGIARVLVTNHPCCATPNPHRRNL